MAAPRTTTSVLLAVAVATAVLVCIRSSGHLASAPSASMRTAARMPMVRGLGQRLRGCGHRSMLARAGEVAEEGDRLKIHFKILTPEGEEITSTKAQGDPIMFTAGAGSMMPGIEKNIIGMKVGETKMVDVAPADGFGEASDENIVPIPMDKLPEGVEVGSILRMGAQGLPVRVTAIADGEATVDINHPLAGRDLKFELELIEATVPPPGLKELVVEQVEEGDKETYPKMGDVVKVHYTGSLLENGNVFDSSRERGQPFTFTIGVGQVIRGWDEGVAKMSKGERAILKIPSEMGYGQMGAGAVIPPDSDLQFDVELIDITPGPSSS